MSLKTSLNPQKLFFIDGLGAFLSAFFLFAILRTYHQLVGIPQSALTLLSVIPLIFCAYSLSCFFFLKRSRPLFLKLIAAANLLYCCLTLGLLIYYRESLSLLGAVYFSGEIIIVCTLVFFELKAANRKDLNL